MGPGLIHSVHCHACKPGFEVQDLVWTLFLFCCFFFCCSACTFLYGGFCWCLQSGKEKWVSQRCVTSDCKRTARLGSVFCSNSCIVRHARESLRQLRFHREKNSGHKVMVVYGGLSLFLSLSLLLCVCFCFGA